MGEVPVPEVSTVVEPQEPVVPGTAPSVHEESEEEMGPPSPLGGMR